MEQGGVNTRAGKLRATLRELAEDWIDSDTEIPGEVQGRFVDTAFARLEPLLGPSVPAVVSPQIRYGLQRFDAVGLFVQWLAEQVSRITERPFEILLMVNDTDPHVSLSVADGAGVLERSWDVSVLNQTLEQDGRGEGLKVLIRETLTQLREAVAE